MRGCYPLLVLLVAVCASATAPPASSSTLDSASPPEPTPLELALDATQPSGGLEELGEKLQSAADEAINATAAATSEDIASTLTLADGPASTTNRETASTKTAAPSASIPPSVTSEAPANETTTASTPPSSPSSSSASTSPPPASSSATFTSTFSSETPLPSPEVHVEPIPLADIPTVPEFLSFNEWRERYVVIPDPSIARRAKKAAQRARQDAVDAPAAGAGGALYDGDGADLGSLFAKPEDGGEHAGFAPVAGQGGVGQPFPGGEVERVSAPPVATAPNPSSSLSSPIQPLPHVGTGDPSDPLLHLKDRSNYAAFECAAMVHRSSRKSKGASSILVEKKDRYMLTPCSAKPKFVDVELCDEIRIDTLVLANFEFFSSTFKHFKASCSVDYPGKADDWHDLGTYRARNVRGIQVFRPTRNRQFCRYLRLEFLSHFGSEYYCPVSLLRVYGYTQLDAYREDERRDEERRKAKEIEDALAAAELIEEEHYEHERRLEDALKVEVANLQRVDLNERPSEGVVTQDVSTAADAATPSPSTSGNAVSTPTASETDIASPPSSTSAGSVPSSTAQPPSSASREPASRQQSNSSPSNTASASPDTYQASSSSLQDTPSPSSSPPTSSPSPSSSSTATSSVASPPAAQNTSVASTVTSSSALSANFSSSPVPTGAVGNSTIPAKSSATTSVPPSPRSSAHPEQPSVSTRPLPRNDSHVAPPPPPPRPPVLAPPVIPQQPQPGESIYGTIMKRLTSLEHNQTLSMHFIEAQSGILREAFARIEKRLSEVEGSKNRQQQHVHQALLELDKHRLELERERMELTTQLSLLTQEVRFEKRLNVAQLVALLVVVVFVGFTRSIPTSPFLHLVSSPVQRHFSTSRLGKEGEAERFPSPRIEQEQEREKAEGSGTDSQRRSHRHSTSVSLSQRQANPSKRHSSLSKPGPRRHYGVGASSSSSKPLSAIRSRPFTPPMRHSSAPPEEPFPSSAALEAKEAARRRIFPGSARKPAPYDFPARTSTKLDNAAGLAINTSPEGELRGSAPAGDAALLQVPPGHPLASSPSLRNLSTADEADTEPSASESPAAYRFFEDEAGVGADADDEHDQEHERLVAIGLASPYSSSSNGAFDAPGEGDVDPDEHGYRTYESDEDGLAAPLPLPPPSRSASPWASSSGRGARYVRLPKPHVRQRPATSMGIPFPSTLGSAVKEVEKIKVEEDDDDEVLRAGPTPSSTLPSPPPEPPERVGLEQGDAR
ncbi:hypothetical protein JCM10207_005330 [Rhodosporidiobolus poonsookiae]